MTTIQNRKLLLIPSEVKDMASKMKSAIAYYSDEMYDAIAPISSYTQESGLSGEAYTNCKNHMLDHITVIRGVIMANKKFESSLDKLSSIVGTERLDEVELEVIIENCVNSIKTYNDRIYDYEIKLRDATYSLYCGDYAHRQIQYCNRVIDNLTKVKKLAENKIIKLHEISAESAKFFADIIDAYSNASEGICSLNAGRISTGFKPILVQSWRNEIKNELGGQSKIDFIKTMTTQFGLNKTQAEIIFELYDRLSLQDNVHADSEFLKIVASFVYGNDEMVPEGAWNFAIGLYDKKARIARLEELGYDEEERIEIAKIITDQHEGCDEKGAIDLAHMFVTIAAIRSRRPQKIVGNVAGIYNGIYSFADNAGYIGDICGTNNVLPIMNKSDYKSDLDAVNLSNRLHTNNQTLIDTVNRYYEDIEEGETNRANEFKNNVGKSRLVENRTKYKEWLTKEYGECIDREKADVYYINDKMHGYKSYQERLKLYDAFVDAINSNSNELEEDLIWPKPE